MQQAMANGEASRRPCQDLERKKTKKTRQGTKGRKGELFKRGAKTTFVQRQALQKGRVTDPHKKEKEKAASLRNLKEVGST